MQTEINSLGVGLPEKTTSPPAPTSAPFLHLCSHSAGNLFTPLPSRQHCRHLLLIQFPLSPTPSLNLRKISPCWNFFHFLYHIFCLPSWSSLALSDHWIPTPPFCTHAAQFTAATYQLGTVTGRSSGSFPKYVGYSPKVIYLKTLTHELCDLYKQKYFLREMTIPQFYFWDTKHEK